MEAFKPCGLGMERQKDYEPPRAEGYTGKKRWTVALEGAGVLAIYAPSRESAIVHAARWFGRRWQDLSYQTDVRAFPMR